ncbi:MAG TPA: hypothetical protein VGP32_10350 [Steroidobacteraceae bacterium]|jgi:hypothetical protein|nr:hypothetical protein [Steroidobacteraceae bacterium]
MRTLLLRLIGIVLAGTALVAASCSSSNNGSGSSSTVTNASAVGVWSGSDSQTGLGVTALINSGGEATFIRSDGTQFVGSVQVSGTTLAVEVDGYSNFPSTFSDGSTYGIGTLDGTVTTGSTLTGTLTFTTTDNTPITGNWSLNFEPYSNTASSTTAVSANYTDIATGSTLSITTTGVMTETGPNNCVLNGSISTADTTHAIYEVAYTYGNCTGTDAGLNGVQFTGLASLNSSTSPAQLTIVVTGASSSAKYAIVSNLTGS